MMWVRHLQLVAFALLASAGAFSQDLELSFHHLTQEDGLTNTINSYVYKDSRGFVWISSVDGLHRFDGAQVKVYRPDPLDSNSLAGNLVTSSFFEDQAGNLYFTTFGMLHKYLRAKDHFERIRLYDGSGEAVKEDYHAFAIDSINGELYVRTGIGEGGLLHIVSTQNQNSRVVGPLQGQRNVLVKINANQFSVVSSIVTRPGLHVSYFTNEALDSTAIYFTRSSATPRKRINNLYVRDLEHIYFGSEEGLGILNAETGESHFYGKFADRSLGRAWSVLPYEGERLLVTSEIGLLVFDLQTEQYVDALRSSASDAYSLTSDDLRELFIDRSGCIWVSIWGRGLSYACPGKRRFELYEWQELGTEGPILSMSSMPGRSTVLYTHSGPSKVGYLNFEDSEPRLPFLTSPTLQELEEVELIYLDVAGIWVTGKEPGLSSRRILLYSDDHGGLLGSGILPYEIRDIERITDNRVLVASEQGVFDLSLDQTRIVVQRAPEFESFEKLPYYRIFDDLQDRLYFSHNFDRLLSFETVGDSLLHLDTYHGVGNIRAIHYSEEDTILWAAGSRGLVQLRPNGEVEQIKDKEGNLGYESLFTLSHDRAGNFWMKSETDVIRYHPVSQESHRYGRADGVQHNRDLDLAFAEDAEGRNYLSGPAGVTIYHPDNIGDYELPAQPQISDIWINDQPWTSDTTASEIHTLRLDHSQNTLRIYFAPCEYSEPAGVEYRYRLDGRDDGWVQVEQVSTARYTNLPWGSYTFHLQASNSDGLWAPNSRSLKIHIKPPWWGTWWAYALYTFLLLALLGFLYRWRTRLHRRKIAMQQKQLAREKAMNDKLRQVDQLKDQFLANTSHELRTPLSGIIGLADSLIDGATGELNAATRSNLAMIAASGKRLSHLVDDILDFSKLKNSDLNLRITPLDLHSICEVVLQLLTPLADAKGLRLINNVPSDLPLVLADENRLQQILVNLVGNGVKFTPEGRVSIGAIVRDERVLISVTDTGMGIRPEKLSSIFNSFEQGDGSAEREFGGTGLGLAISKQLVELHGGSIEVSSEAGRGSTFTFTLNKGNESSEKSADQREVVVPTTALAVDMPIVDTTTSQQFHNVALDKVRILAVDDEQVNLQVLKNHLSLEEIDVSLATNGDQALRMVEEEGPFDLVLLDIMMPRMNGFQVCRILRESYLPSELPIIMLTAKNQVADLVQGFDVGANDYLSKPFSKDELISRIRIHLRLHRIYQATGKFVPRQFLKTIGRDEITEVRLGDHNVCEDITVLFADIQNYTPLAEQMTPEESFLFVNAFAGRMGPIIDKYNGFVNQHLGDAVMAIFPESTDETLQAAIEMHQVIRKYSEERQALGRSPISIRIGAHTGTLIMGIIGHLNRSETATVSDTVNMASRVEGLTKYYGCNILISEATYSLLTNPGKFNLRRLGVVQVKGRKDPTAVYECLEGDPPALRESKMFTLDLFNEALKAFEAGDFAVAKQKFVDLLEQSPEDLPARRLLASTESKFKEMGKKSWQGIQAIRTK